MRGADNTQSGGIKYLNFMGGKFVQRVPEGTEGSNPRELKKGPNTGATVHELHYDTYVGQIYNIDTEDRGEYGVSLNIFIDVSTDEDPDSKVKLSLSLSSGPAKGFLSRLPVIDFAKDVTLKGFSILNKENGRTNQYLVPYQDGKKLESQFTKDNPGALPKMVKIKVKGKEQWDDSAQLEFYEGLIKEVFSFELSTTKGPEEPEEVSEEDELPF